MITPTRIWMMMMNHMFLERKLRDSPSSRPPLSCPAPATPAGLFLAKTIHRMANTAMMMPRIS
ncbi:MAG: hypothetical protein SVP26_09865 [Chloroflexota bacterium]|nr:hypothetical protein [Chloroflexota bacterium]